MTEKIFKNMTKEEKVLTVAKYIIENKSTIKETAEKFEISVSSIKKYINNKENLQSIDYNAYLLVKEIQDQLQIVGRTTGGATSKRTATISEFEAEEIATVMLERGLTLEQASVYFDNVAVSTLYENLMKLTDEELKDKLQVLFNENNKVKGGKR